MPGKNGCGRAATYVLALAAGVASPLAGQEAEEPPLEFWSQLHGKVAFFGQVALPADEEEDAGVLGGGAALVATIWHREQPRVGLRFEMDAVEYEDDESTLTSAGIGPQLYFRDGTIRPYAFATLGGAEVRSEGWPERWDREPIHRDAYDLVRGYDWVADTGDREGERRERERDGEWRGYESYDRTETGAYVGLGLGVEMQMYTGTLPVSLDLSISHMSRSRSSTVAPLDSPYDRRAKVEERGGERDHEEEPWPRYYGEPRGVPDRALVDLVKVRFGVSVALF
ncbi:MAG: hypothetical protein J4F34_02355 [Gemmatimonadetes bacterium]|nr:hypothetical protein [Gemmatimonadota bacterium]